MKRTAIVLAAGLTLVALSLWFMHGGADPSGEARAAYQRGDYASAIREYQKAAPYSIDLAALAANQGAALYRLDRYGDADGRYQLAEAAGGEARAAQAAYDRGNCALREACQDATRPDPTKLEEAAQRFRTCLAREPVTALGDLLSDARHNLELTKLLQAPKAADEQVNSAAHDDARASDREPRSGDHRQANDRSNNSQTENRSLTDGSAENPRPTATFANFLARKDEDDYLCPDCRRELEKAGLVREQTQAKPNGSQGKDSSQDSKREGTAGTPAANGERRADESAGMATQAGRRSQDAKQRDASKEEQNSKENRGDKQAADAKQGDATKEQQKPKESPRDKQAADAGGESGEWRDPPKQQQGKPST
jgi:hypothetical protein